MIEKANELGLKPINEGKLCSIVTECPLGLLSIAATSTGIAAIEFGEMDFTAIAKKMKLQLVYGSTPLLEKCIAQLNEYFAGKRRNFSLPLYLVGTDFQQKVWKTLMTIPYGTTICYKEEAQRAGNEKAIRAVAQANGANPIPIIIPCHRVINANGTLGGYSSGIDKKQFLLDLEQKH